MSQCTSTLDGRQCERTAGHPVGTNVWREPNATHQGGAHSWTDAAADIEPDGSGSGS